ncbi:helix-turn-helix transcriptional regulator [Treponema parvum]|uniref:Helix-turn-helix transcriptional regulator n=1 Tax=Treponema parvum TaxID=138851 RepID=A0A975IFA0_9SPIR|nr:AraC family transcriptional regulator [Treponema parvum]QTQ14652.1 helix-turn-helix transcriptional regulator [Treponema parvum]
MTKSYQSFIEHTGSTLTKKGAVLNECFDTYQFSSDYGNGYTAVYELDSYASICIAEHSYVRDFEYAVTTEDSIIIQQYDSIDSDRRYPQGNVSAGMQYIDYAPGNRTYRYVIKKDVPAKVIGVQLMPDYYEMYLKKESGIKGIDLKKDLQAFPHGVVIPEIAAIFSRIRTFNGNGLSTRLFFKGKIDELTAIIIQKAEEFRLPDDRKIAAADRHAVARVIAYMNDHLSKNFLLSELASEAYMSVSKFKYVFKAVTGQTYSDYIMRKKMECACDLLKHNNLYVSEIAYRLGYENAGSFSVQFKNYTGILPSDFRVNRAT